MATTTKQFIEALEKASLSANQWRVISAIYSEPGHKCSPNRLMELLNVPDLITANGALGKAAHKIGKYLRQEPEGGAEWVLIIADWNGKNPHEWTLHDNFVSALHEVGVGRERVAGLDEMDAASANWSKEELKASVKAYLDMKSEIQRGVEVNKKLVYRDLSKRFGRSEKAYEYRMQNISYVLSLAGRDWIAGLLPATNVGANVAAQIEDILAEIEERPAKPSVLFEAEVRAKRKKANLPKPSGANEPQAIVRQATGYVRDPDVVAWVLQQSRGRCECCDKPAPFLTCDGKPFLEVHHVRQLAEKGPDIVENAVALCPNCHREIHHGANSNKLVEHLYATVTRLVRQEVLP